MKLIIEQLKEGFIFIDEDGEKYAVSESKLSEKVKAYFGLTKHEEKKREAPPAKVSEDTKPETQGNKTPDSHSGGAILMTKRSDPEEAGEEENTHRYEDILQSSSTAQERVTKPPVTQSAKSKLGTPDNHIMHPSDLKIPKFEYDKSKMQKYKHLIFQELPDGKVILNYCNSHYYSSKDAVMQIPYPFPQGYFSKENGWSSSIEQAFKTYRRYLFEKMQEQQIEKEREEDPDDWKYKPLLSVNTRTDYDGNKIEGSLEE